MMNVALRIAVSILLGAVGAQAAAPPAVRCDISIGVRGRLNAAPSVAAIGRVVVLAWGASIRGTMDV
jgi:hypothetical protein